MRSKKGEYVQLPKTRGAFQFPPKRSSNEIFRSRRFQDQPLLFHIFPLEMTSRSHRPIHLLLFLRSRREVVVTIVLRKVKNMLADHHICRVRAMHRSHKSTVLPIHVEFVHSHTNSRIVVYICEFIFLEALTLAERAMPLIIL